MASGAVLALVACGDDGSTEPAGQEVTVTVFAAASLTDAFDTIADAYEDAHAATKVTLSYAGSSALRAQILEGAPADVFASANESNMDQVVDGGAAEDPEVFVENELQVVVPAGNPGRVTGLSAFADPDLLVGLCAEEVPCGELARAALAKAGVTPSIDTNEPDARALLTKVEAGEIDAGIVYRTDVLAAGEAVEGIEIPAEQNVIASYPIAVLTDAPEPDAAAEFVAFVLSDAGLAILGELGFTIP